MRGYTTTIAAIMFSAAQPPRHNDVADQLMKSQLADKAQRKAVSWDCDDLVFLDFDGMRVALQHVKLQDHNSNCLCIGVGAAPNSAPLIPSTCAYEAERLVQLISKMYQVSTVMWHNHSGILDASSMDSFGDELAKMIDHLNDCLTDLAPLKEDPSSNLPTPENTLPKPASRITDETALAKLRDSLAQHHDNKKSRPAIQATVYLMASTFLFLAPPVGSALFSYAALRNALDKS